MSEIQKKTGFYKSFDGTPIYYEVRGDGRPLVMCYGIGCSMNHWRHQVKYFSKHYKIILFDYRGHHRSGLAKDLKNYSLSSLAEDLNGLMAHLGIRKASFWSHSFGSQVLIETYRRHPSLFSNMVIINGFATNPLKKTLVMDIPEHAFRAIKSIYQAAPQLVRPIWKVAVNNPLSATISALAGGFNLKLTKRHDIDVYTRGVAAMNLTSFLTIFENMLKYDGRDILPKITVPALLIGGKQDSITPVILQRRLHEKIKRSELLLAPYCSHSTQLDMPDFVNLRAEKFLRDHRYR